jgi:hypothetical protein
VAGGRGSNWAATGAPAWRERTERRGLVLVDRAALDRHRKAIQENEKGWFVWGELERLSTACHVYRATGQTDQDELCRHITAVTTHVQDLRTIVAKLDWMRELRDAEQLDSYTWIYFAATDVVSFLTNVRSMFDRLARAMRAAANQPGSVPLLSFNELQKWLASHAWIMRCWVVTSPL